MAYQDYLNNLVPCNFHGEALNASAVDGLDIQAIFHLLYYLQMPHPLGLPTIKSRGYRGFDPQKMCYLSVCIKTIIQSTYIATFN